MPAAPNSAHSLRAQGASFHSINSDKVSQHRQVCSVNAVDPPTHVRQVSKMHRSQIYS